jgi:uncharacterized membrane protein
MKNNEEQRLGRINRDVVIDAPVGTVYNYVSDPRNAPNYISSIKRIISGPDLPPQEGQVWVAEADFLGGMHRLNLRIAQLSQEAEVRFALEGSLQGEVTLLLTPSPRNTRTAVALYLAVESAPTLLLNALIGGLLADDMQRLKSLLEQ